MNRNPTCCALTRGGHQNSYPTTPKAGTLAIFLALVVFLFASCQKSPTAPPDAPPVTSAFELGTKSTVATQAISSSGGTLTVTGSPSQLGGLTLTVPDTGYPQSRTFIVSSAPIKSSKLPANVIALTPMITIENGGGYSTTPMTVQIPITLPTGSFAAAFYYNDATGELEPIPVINENSTSITISTRHFSTSTIGNSARVGKGSVTPQAMSYSDIVILAMDENKLFAVGNQMTQFKPGTDDWEFINYGSYIAPKGHCSGQSLSAMWYYYQQKKAKGPTLNNYFGSNPNFRNWPSDNRLGYRFASAIQKDQRFTGWVNDVSFQARDEQLTFKLFLLGIYVSQQPQSILIYNSKDQSGHAMICYGVEYADKLNGKLVVADPNHPGQRNEIDYVNGVLQIYTTGLRADGAPVDFDLFGDLAKTAYIEWDQIGVRWAQVMAGTIGNIAPRAFPRSAIRYVDPGTHAYVVMPSSFTLNSDTLDIDYDADILRTYRTDGSQLSWTGSKTALQYGKNIIGFFSHSDPAGQKDYQWVDFVWDTIYSTQVAIDPPTLNAQTGVAYTFRATSGVVPANTRYEWDFGDATPLTVITNTAYASHTYSKSGQFTVSLAMYDVAKNLLLGKAISQVTIAGALQLTSLVPEDISYDMPFTVNGTGFGATQGTSTVLISGTPPGRIISWSDTKIVATTPNSPTSPFFYLTVTVGGQVSNMVQLHQGNAAITSLSKSHARSGDPLEIRGHYFGYSQGPATVYFREAGTPFTVVSWTDSVIQLIVPDQKDYNYGSGSIYVHRTNWPEPSTAFTMDEHYLKTLFRTNDASAFLTGYLKMYHVSLGERLESSSVTIAVPAGSGLTSSWTGNTVTGSYNGANGPYENYSISASATFNDSGSLMLSYNGTYDWTYTNGTSRQSMHRELVLKDIRLSMSIASQSPLVRFELKGPEVASHITTCVSQQMANDVLQIEYRGTDWTNVTAPSLSISFSKK